MNISVYHDEITVKLNLKLLLLFLLFYRLRPAKSKMAFPGRISPGTKTAFHSTMFLMVRRNHINCNALLHCFSLSVMRFNIFFYHFFSFLSLPVVNVLPTVTVESSGLFSVKSELSLKVTKEDKDATLYCDVSFFVPGETRMFESKNFTITVYCEFHTLKLQRQYKEEKQSTNQNFVSGITYGEIISKPENLTGVDVLL